MRRANETFQLRTHRAGLITELLKQDPDLQSLRRHDDLLVQNTSDVAHTRAMLMLTPRERIRYIPKVLYRYNMGNPQSHFHGEARDGQYRECRNIGDKPALQVTTRFAPFCLEEHQKTRLMVIILTGADWGICEEMLRQQELPHIRNMMDDREVFRFPAHRGFGNYQPMRELLCEQRVSEHDNHARFVQRKNAYSRYGFGRLHMMSGPFFGASQLLDGRHYAVLGLSEVNIPEMDNLTLISQWLCHAKFSETRIHPPELRSTLENDERYQGYDISLERHSIADEEEALKVLDFLSERLELKAEVYERILNRGEWDCVITGMDELHDMGHLLWHFWDPEHPLYQAGTGRVRERIKALYRQVDKNVGRLLERAGPVPSVLVGGPSMQVNGSLNGYLDTMLRCFEEIFTGEPVLRAARNRDRLFYALYTDPAGGGIRLNLRGREPAGKIDQERYAEACEFLVECFSEIINQNNGNPVTREVYRCREHYDLGEDSAFPDLLCIWEPGSVYGAIHSARLGTIELELDPDNELDFRTGDHNGDTWAVFNKQAAPFFPQEEDIRLHRMGHHFRTIVNSFK